MKTEQLDIPNIDIVRVGEGPDLLLLHTLLAERTVFDRALPELAAKYRLTVPNLPGYGGTPALDNPAPSVRDYADWIAGMVSGFDDRLCKVELFETCQTGVVITR